VSLRFWKNNVSLAEGYTGDWAYQAIKKPAQGRLSVSDKQPL